MKLANINTTNIAGAIQMGCCTMSSVFNVDDHNIPFFDSTVYPEARLSFSDKFSEAHVPGRHLNAHLAAEDALGLALEPGVIEKHARAVYFSYSGGLPLPLQRLAIGKPLDTFYDHNLREGFHALYALARFRRDERALELARSSIKTIVELSDPDHNWRKDRFCAAGITLVPWGFICGIGRAIGPLLKLHQWTDCAEALDLAQALTEHAVAGYFLEDGLYNDKLPVHTHSATCTLSGLAMMAEFTKNKALIERVKSFYDRGLWSVRDQIGWVIETANSEGSQSESGESNNTGDVLETGLSLARLGYPEYYDDVELILRAHLLPSQLRDVSFITNQPNPMNEDGLRDFASRHLGAFGFPSPYGHVPLGDSIKFNMDIVGGVVGSLVAAWQNVATRDDTGLRVNMLFDYESDWVKIESPYTVGELRITPKHAGSLAIRVPGWSDSNEWEMLPRELTWKLDGRYLCCEAVPAGTTVAARFPLCQRQLVLTHKTRDIRVSLRGDEPVAMDNFDSNFTFFDPL